MRYMASPCLFIYNYIYTSRFAASACGGPQVPSRPTSFAAHIENI